MISEGIRALFFMAGVAAGAAIGYTLGTVEIDRRNQHDAPGDGHQETLLESD